MPQYKPLPPALRLATTLARRVYQLRELRNLTLADLARLSRFPAARLEDIESGVETWLSSTDRQLLAKALVVEPALLEEVELRPGPREPSRAAPQGQLAELILGGARDLRCPDCGAPLVCSRQDALDLDGNPMCFAKAYCTRCPFVLR